MLSELHSFCLLVRQKYPVWAVFRTIQIELTLWWNFQFSLGGGGSWAVVSPAGMAGTWIINMKAYGVISSHDDDDGGDVCERERGR